MVDERIGFAIVNLNGACGRTRKEFDMALIPFGAVLLSSNLESSYQN
jgi:hypothetical protein